MRRPGAAGAALTWPIRPPVRVTPARRGRRSGTPCRWWWRRCTGGCHRAGEARNRVRLAVERTVPFAMLVHTLIVIWYARHRHDPADIDDRRAAQPWYRTKTEPAFEAMLTKLRRTLIAARFSGTRPAQPTDEQVHAVLAAWDAAAA